MAADTPLIAEQGVATLPTEAWEQARRRTEVIGPLAALEVVGHEAADAAAQALGLSQRQVYVLIRRARQGTGLVTDLAPGQSSGGKGKGRLSEPVEHIIRELLQNRFLTKQKRSQAAFHREVARACIAGVICLILQITVVGWLPATIWAVYSLSQCKTDKKIEKALGQRA